MDDKPQTKDSKTATKGSVRELIYDDQGRFLGLDRPLFLLPVALLGFYLLQSCAFDPPVAEAPRADTQTVGFENRFSPVIFALPESKIDRRIADRFPGADPLVTEAVGAIYRGRTPDEMLLQAIATKGLLDKVYESDVEKPKDGDTSATIRTQSTLLSQAFALHNLNAARALISAGADPRVQNDHIAFSSARARTYGSPDGLDFPDYRAGQQLLDLYLSAGGSVYAQDARGRPLVGVCLRDNPGCLATLIKHGLDPWAPIEQDGTGSLSLFEMLGALLPDHRVIDTLHTLLQSGLVAPPQDQQAAYNLAGALSSAWVQARSKIAPGDAEPAIMGRISTVLAQIEALAPGEYGKLVDDISARAVSNQSWLLPPGSYVSAWAATPRGNKK